MASPPSAGCHTCSPVSGSTTHSPSAYSSACVGLLLGELGLALDVDPPAGEAGGEAGVLALLADGQRQLEVGDDDLGGAGLLVDPDLLDLGRRQRLGHEVGRVLGERDDVDLLAPQLVDDHADAGAPGADAGADRVDVGVVRPDGDLRAVAGLAGAGLDLDDAVGDLGHLELEEALDEAGVGAADTTICGPFAVLRTSTM